MTLATGHQLNAGDNSLYIDYDDGYELDLHAGTRSGAWLNSASIYRQNGATTRLVLTIKHWPSDLCIIYRDASYPLEQWPIHLDAAIAYFQYMDTTEGAIARAIFAKYSDRLRQAQPVQHATPK